MFERNRLRMSSLVSKPTSVYTKTMINASNTSLAHQSLKSINTLTRSIRVSYSGCVMHIRCLRTSATADPTLKHFHSLKRFENWKLPRTVLQLHWHATVLDHWNCRHSHEYIWHELFLHLSNSLCTHDSNGSTACYKWI